MENVIDELSIRTCPQLDISFDKPGFSSCTMKHTIFLGPTNLARTLLVKLSCQSQALPETHVRGTSANAGALERLKIYATTASLVTLIKFKIKSYSSSSGSFSKICYAVLTINMCLSVVLWAPLMLLAIMWCFRDLGYQNIWESSHLEDISV